MGSRRRETSLNASAPPTSAGSGGEPCRTLKVVESQLGPDGARQADAFLRRAGVVVEPVTIQQATWLGRLFSTSAKAGPRQACTLAPVLPTRSRERPAKG